MISSTCKLNGDSALDKNLFLYFMNYKDSARYMVTSTTGPSAWKEKIWNQWKLQQSWNLLTLNSMLKQYRFYHDLHTTNRVLDIKAHQNLATGNRGLNLGPSNLGQQMIVLRHAWSLRNDLKYVYIW